MAANPPTRTLVFHPIPGLTTGAGDPVLGVMRVTVAVSKRKTRTCCYVVTEVPTGWPGGRAFRLRKAADTPGTDPDEESYDVFLGATPADRNCTCKGFQRWGDRRGTGCVHLAALAALLTSGRL